MLHSQIESFNVSSIESNLLTTNNRTWSTCPCQSHWMTKKFTSILWSWSQRSCRSISYPSKSTRRSLCALALCSKRTIRRQRSATSSASIAATAPAPRSSSKCSRRSSSASSSTTATLDVTRACATSSRTIWSPSCPRTPACSPSRASCSKCTAHLVSVHFRASCLISCPCV